jgi:hypothetical protein
VIEALIELATEFRLMAEHLERNDRKVIVQIAHVRAAMSHDGAPIRLTRGSGGSNQNPPGQEGAVRLDQRHDQQRSPDHTDVL